jgi:hypothetical protein
MAQPFALLDQLHAHDRQLLLNIVAEIERAQAELKAAKEEIDAAKAERDAVKRDTEAISNRYSETVSGLMRVREKFWRLLFPQEPYSPLKFDNLEGALDNLLAAREAQQGATSDAWKG